MERNDSSHDQERNSFTPFGNAVLSLVVALLLLGLPTYLQPGALVESFFSESAGSTVGAIFAILCYAGFAIFAFFAISFVTSTLQKDHDLRHYLRMLFGSSDGWENAFASATMIFIAVMIHLVGLVVFGIAGLAALPIRIVVCFLGLMGLVLGVRAIDTFFFRPLLHTVRTTEPDADAISSRAKKIGFAIVTILASIGTFLAAISELIR